MSVEVNNELIGYGFISQVDSDLMNKKSGELFGLWVKEDSLERGVGPKEKYYLSSKVFKVIFRYHRLMILTNEEINRGLDHVAQFLQHESSDELNQWGIHDQKERLKHWLFPCLLLLPQEVHSSEFLEEEFVYLDLLMPAGVDFLVNELRNNKMYDEYNESDLQRRLHPDAIIEAVENLGYLCGVFLEGIEETQSLPDNVIPLLSGLPTSITPESIDRGLKDLMNSHDNPTDI